MRTNKLRAVLPHPTDPTSALVELTRGCWAAIDAADAAEIGRWNWTTKPVSPEITYARRAQNGKTVTLHRFIGSLMGFSSALDVDHRNGNGLDCRRRNLRPATKSQNQFNKRLSKANRSGIKGVSWDPRRKKWSARLEVEKRQVRLGRFADLQAAVDAVTAARIGYHGSFANHGRPS